MVVNSPCSTSGGISEIRDVTLVKQRGNEGLRFNGQDLMFLVILKYGAWFAWFLSLK